MNKSMSSPDIFDFTNYRQYLQAIAVVWTGQGKSWRDLSKFCGFSSPNFIQQIIQGKRNLTIPSGRKLASRFGLSSDETQFLEHMIHLSRATNSEEIDINLAKMKHLIGRARRQLVHDHSIYDHWLYGVVFELFKTKQCTNVDDLCSLSLRLSVTKAELKSAFDFLSRKGYLKSEGRTWVANPVDFAPQNDVRRINSQQNHLKWEHYAFLEHQYQ